MTNKSEVPGAAAKDLTAKDYIHLGIEFSKQDQFMDAGDNYRSGVGFGYSCGFQDGVNQSQAGASWAVGENARLREALEKIHKLANPKNTFINNYEMYEVASEALLPTPPIKNANQIKQ